MIDLEAELQKQYPDGNFEPYWIAVEKCRRTEKDYTHDHHLLPEKQFPQFADFKLFPENKLVANASLERNEHAWLHRILEECGGPKAPPSAFFESQRGGCAKGGRSNVENGTGWFGRSKEKMTEDGRIGGRSNAENKTGFCAPGVADRGRHTRWHVNRGIVNPNCSLCIALAAISPS